MSHQSDTSLPLALDETSTLIDHYTNIAWVPTLIGKLDFTRFSACDSKKVVWRRPAWRNLKSPIPLLPRRYKDALLNAQVMGMPGQSFVSTIKDWKDEKKKQSGDFRMFVFAQKHQPGAVEIVSGSVFVSPPEKEVSDCPHFQKIANLVDEKFPLVNYVNEKLSQSEGRVTKVSSALKPDFDTALSFIKYLKGELNTLESSQAPVYRVDFTLKSNGLCFLSSVECVNIAHMSDEKKLLNPEVEQVVPRQVFYYLKHSIHAHKHHPKQADSLTTTHKISKGDPGSAFAGILDDLSDSLVDAKNLMPQKRVSSSHIEGVTSYSQSLVEVLFQEGILESEVRDSQLNFFGNFTSSACAIGSRTEDKQKVTDRYIVRLGLTLSLLTAVMSLTSIAGRNILTPQVFDKKIIEPLGGVNTVSEIVYFFLALPFVLAAFLFLWPLVHGGLQNLGFRARARTLKNICSYKAVGLVDRLITEYPTCVQYCLRAVAAVTLFSSAIALADYSELSAFIHECAMDILYAALRGIALAIKGMFF